MKTKQETVIRGLACSILIEEITETDALGNYLFTLSRVYVLDASGKKLVGRSRLPNAIDALKKEIKRDGIQVFQKLQNSVILK